jgi:hypothetical protein
MRVIVRMAPGTTQRALARNLNGKRGPLSLENLLRDLRDRKGQDLIDGVFDVVDRFKPLHLAIVGGDPLVRYRELELMIPQLLDRRYDRFRMPLPGFELDEGQAQQLFVLLLGACPAHILLLRLLCMWLHLYLALQVNDGLRNRPLSRESS